jgi:hypothetical protein
MPKWALLDDIDAWIKEQTGDATDGLRNGDRISLRDLNAICRAIEYSKGKKK